MAEVKLNGPIFKVELTEYERGWGEKHWDTKYFDNESEARKWAYDYNVKYNSENEVPDWYVRAEYVGKV